MNMNTLVSNINRRGQEDLSFKVRHKATTTASRPRVEGGSAIGFHEMVIADML
jgi:hypothetical protein